MHQDIREFLKHYPRCANRRLGLREAEDLWNSFTAAEREKCVAGVKVFADAWGRWTVEDQKFTVKPSNWLHSFMLFDFEVPEDRWERGDPPKFENRPQLVNHEWADRWYVWVGDKKYGPFESKAEAETSVR